MVTNEFIDTKLIGGANPEVIVTTYELIQKLSAYTNALSNESPFIQRLSEISNNYYSIFEQLGKSFDFDNELGLAYISDLRTRLTQLASDLNNFSPRKIFSEIDKLLNILSEIDRSLQVRGNMVMKTIITNLETFSNVFEKFFKKSSEANAAQVLIWAQFLYRSITITQELVAELKEALESETNIVDKNYKELSIFLTVTPTYDGLLTKLTALSETYNELCLLLNVSVTDYHLRISKIETGSLWVKIFGEPRVISLIISFIESTIIFLYRNFTNEGKLSSIPRKIDAIEAILQLSGKLEEQGIETSGIKDNLQKSSVIISQQLNNLLLGEPSIKINDKSYSLEQSLQEKFLLEGKRLLLEGRNKQADETVEK